MNMNGKKGLVLIMTLVLVLFFSSCVKTSYEGSNNIIEADELKAVINDASTIVIDARSLEDYDKGHLKGAINITPGQLTVSEPVANMLAPKEQIEQVLSSYGVSNDDYVYIYDNNGGVSASRVWWTLRIYGHEHVKVINNGETAIVNGGFELTRDVPLLEATTYTASPMNESMYADIKAVESVIEGAGEGAILDVRSLAEYDEGAIPGAILYPHTKNLYTDGSFKSAQTIYLDYKDLGLEKDELIILYCKSSYRATQTVLLLEEAGYTNLKVYDGAWLEWSTKDMPKEEKKEEVSAPTSQDGS